MTIDLTPAELREFVRLWRTEPRTMAETSALRKLEQRIPTFLPTTLALALAEAMEEIAELKSNYVHADVALDAEGYKRKCKQLQADLEAAREGR